MSTQTSIPDHMYSMSGVAVVQTGPLPAMMMFGIKVTDEDIAGAKRKDPENCPIARCLRRCFPAFSKVSVHNGNVVYSIEGDQREYSLSLGEQVAAWVANYDLTGSAAPVSLFSGGDVSRSGSVPSTRP